MGVNGIQNYIENGCPASFRKVNIKDLSDQTTSRKPQLVVDGMSVLQRLYQMDNLEWVYGGQWKKYVENIKVFVDRFKEDNIYLVFYFDGSTKEKKLEDWIEQGTKNLKDIKKIFDHIMKFQTHPDESLRQIPAALSTLFRYALKYVCGCSVVNSFTDVHSEIANYAFKQVSCFGILGDNSDYMIFNTKPYLSVAHLKLGPLETICYDRRTFATSLNLKEAQLSLLACLIGNDIVTVESVYPLHCYLAQSKSFTKIEMVTKVAEYIIKCNWKGGQYSNETVNQFAQQIGLNGETLLKGLKYYKCVEEEQLPDTPGVISGIVNQLKQKHSCGKPGKMERSCSTFHCKIIDIEAGPKAFVRNCELNSHILTLLRRLEFMPHACLEDSKQTGLIPSGLIFRRIRERMYSLLFNSNTVEVEEVIFTQDVPPMPEKIKPISFLIQGQKQPQLMALWEKSSGPTGVRWRTFMGAMNLSLSEKNMKRLAPNLVPFACLLNFLLVYPVGEPRLMAWEVDALIAQIVSPLASAPDEIRELQIPYVEPRAVNLASIILEGLSAILDLNQICGEVLNSQDILPWQCFDGKLFHFLYIMAKHGATMEVLMQNDEQATRDFIKLRSVCIAGTYIIRERYHNTLPPKEQRKTPTTTTS